MLQDGSICERIHLYMHTILIRLLVKATAMVAQPVANYESSQTHTRKTHQNQQSG